MKKKEDAPKAQEEQCKSTFGGQLAPVGFGVQCELPANHLGRHRGGGGAWITRTLKVDRVPSRKAGRFTATASVESAEVAGPALRAESRAGGEGKKTMYTWKLNDDQSISLRPENGALELSPAFASHFRFIYRDPLKLAEVLRKIADCLLACQVGVRDENDDWHLKPCGKPATVFTDYVLTGDDAYLPAKAVCDEHERQRLELEQKLKQQREQENTEF